MNWEEFLFYTGQNMAVDCVFAPRRENVYNEPSISFYKDGTVWVGGAKGSVRVFKNCPYSLMCEIYKQRYKEVVE